MTKFAMLWKKHKILSVSFFMAVALTILFAVRTAVFLAYWSDPEHRDQPIDGWMTPGYVAQSWDIPRDVIAQALSLEPDGRRQSLESIAKGRGVPLANLQDLLEKAIQDYRAR